VHGDWSVVLAERPCNGKNTICLWYDEDAEATARVYAETFPTAVGAIHRLPGLKIEDPVRGS